MSVIDYKSENHTYTIDGIPAISVTKVLEMAGLTNFQFAKQEDIDFGTKVHYMCELHDRGILDHKSLHPLLLPYWESYKKFLLDYKPTIMHTELIVGTKALMVAGRIDRVMGIAGMIYIADIKSGAEGSAEIQTAGYKILYNSDKKKPWLAVSRMAIMLNKEGAYRIESYRDKSDENVFLSALNIARYKLNRG